MKAFADLYDAIDRTTSTSGKVEALAHYFRTAPPDDAAWALYFLTGRRLKRLMPTRHLVNWTLALTDLPDWMLSECYGAVGDLAEVIALLLDQRPLRSLDEIEASDTAGARARPAASLLDLADADASVAPAIVAAGDEAPGPALAGATRGDASRPLHEWIEDRIMALRTQPEAVARRMVSRWWTVLPRRERFLLNKLLTGEFRVGVSQTLVVRGLAQAFGLPVSTIEHRLMGHWEPTADVFRALGAPDETDVAASRPYPFFLASQLDGDPNDLGDPSGWLVEWKWDGIRAQLITRAGEVFLWSRGEELVTERYPDIAHAARDLPAGTVLDGEILPFRDGRPLPFAALQRRIGRERRVAEMARDVPVVFMAYDLLEDRGEDIRTRPLAERRERLEALLAGGPAAFRLSEIVSADSWGALDALRAQSRSRGVEGFMLKRKRSPYGSGRRGNDWWKWKVDPYTVDAVLIYAQPGNGRRANLFTDYTFGVWDGPELVPFAKAYSGLSDEEIAELDRWIRRHTRERFGPVSAVEPRQVFELGFEAIARSTRHRSGIAVRFPRIRRWRKDKPPSDADTLETVARLIRSDV